MQTTRTIRLHVSAFMADASEASRVCALLNSLPGYSLQGPSRGALPDLACADARGGGMPAAVLLLVDGDGLERCCTEIAQLHVDLPGIPLLVLANGISATCLSRLMSFGIYDFGMLPSSDAEIVMRVGRAIGTVSLPSESTRSGTSSGSTAPTLSSKLIGKNTEFLKILRRLPVMAVSNASMLLLGETGTGKEVVAQAIHYASPRANGPWVAINCAAIPADLMEAELFGHARGAYTNAHAAREGLVREAEGGTLFLDEIDALSLAAQAKLLRFLEDKQYRLVGSSILRNADVRIIAASNRDLRHAATNGNFRSDLLFRLNVLTLCLPSLRERRDDIPALAQHFFRQANFEQGRHLVGITPAAMQRLLVHDWPGNVRELKHVIERAVLLAEGQSLQPGDIEIDGTDPVDDMPLSFRDAKALAIKSFERSYLEQLMLENQGNISRAARAAQKNRRALFELLRRHDIDTDRFRA